MKDLLPCPYVDDLSLLTDQIDFHLLIEEGRAISLRTPDWNGGNGFTIAVTS